MNVDRKQSVPAEPGSMGWILERLQICFREKRLPGLGGAANFLAAVGYKTRLRLQFLRRRLFEYKKPPQKKGHWRKCLYASPVGQAGKRYLARVIEKFGHDRFDYLIFVWDDTKFEEPIFRNCTFIYEKGLKWYFMKKYLTPERCDGYDYIFVWDDDIDISNFCVENFLNIMERNELEVAQPALLPGSFYAHKVTLQHSCKVGRLTDYVEVMIQVFEREAWAKFWNILESDWNHWGWGYDDLARSLCGYKKMGVIDCEAVLHTKAISQGRESAYEEKLELLNKYRMHMRALKIAYGKLR